MGKLWGGRFEADMDPHMEQLNASIRFDRRLYAADIRGSQAYARALVGAGVLTAAEVEQIVAGLDEVLAEFQTDRFEYKPNDEDIHTAVERRLGEKIGPVAGKLHTGRSRNDQVATDTRLYLLWQIADLRSMVRDVQCALVMQAEDNIDVRMPGYTHLQPAQPILYSHWLLSTFWMLERDLQRLDGVEQRTSVLPLGASALAGNAFDVDCPGMAKELGFAGIAHNSLDAVSDRDFIAEFLFWAAMLGFHLSRLGEDLIIWTNPLFGFVEIAEAYSTGSSIMPQKRNPDSAELLRGKTGRLTGNLIALLTMLKGLPSSYDKDLQEDKEPLFDALDTLRLTLPVAAGLIATMRVNPERTEAALSDEMLATELADYLVDKGVPFRESHHVIGQVVRRAAETGHTLCSLSLADYQAIDVRFGPDLYDALDAQTAIDRRDVPCGTSTRAVKAQIEQARERIGPQE
jgi:argininosuccinate lyase